ncbi:MAG: hypothetical protein JO354_07410 [Verrucomicrobia bacterium]|nr:hypothetical protein [Verrucomicrobiota bacterium]
MKRTSLLLAVAGAFAGTLLATTVIPPSFDELVSRAQMIFQGTVTNVSSQWTGEGAQRHIVSYVTLNVDDTYKGDPGKQITLRMLGGTVGDETMEVSDAPKFKPGDRDVLFVENNGSQFIPLVGIMHGRYRIEKDQAGRDVIMTNSGAPLGSVTQVGKAEGSQAQSIQAQQPMTLQQFKQAIQAKAHTAAP